MHRFSCICIPPFNICKKIFPAEIVGRDLDMPIGKSFGHVGITTAPMNSSSGMNQVAY